MALVADLVAEAFILGYTQESAAPPGERALTVCHFLMESDEASARLLYEAGKREAKRSTRERHHRALYAYHGRKIAKAWQAVLASLPVAEIAHQAAEHAALASQSASTPVLRRRAVAGAVSAVIAAHLLPDQRYELDQLNADGWAHADAYGTAEAQTTPESGGPPRTAKLAALAATAAAAITPSRAAAASFEWTGEQLQTLAMGAALAAGDGSALGESVRSVKAALQTTDRATRLYTDQLHRAVTTAYVMQTQQDRPGVKYRWVTASNPCPSCEALSLEGPYDPTALPDGPPLHPNCLCDLEAVSAALIGADA